jgi:hypothetical protein
MPLDWTGIIVEYHLGKDLRGLNSEEIYIGEHW